ncbi:MAG: glycosyltransferase [Candidatus Natronoplasma sp.]
MRIIILTDELPEDISNFNVDIITNAIHLSERGHEVFLVSHAGSEIKGKKFTHFPMGYDVSLEKDSPLSFLMRNITFFDLTLPKIKDISPDLILCTGGGQMLLNFWIGLFFSRLLSEPMISEWRGSELLMKDSIYRKISKRYILKHSSLNILRSNQMKKKVHKIEPDSEIVILPSKGVDMKKFSPDKINEQTNEGKIELLFVGRLHEVKGLNNLFRAFKVVKENHLDTRLTLVGEGPLKEDLKEEAATLGIFNSVEFLGEIDHDELPQYYRGADIFVLTSLSEGLSNVLMEAMACALPVIATNVGGNTELVKSGKGGFLVNPGDSKDLSKTLIDLIERPELRKKMGEFNRNFIEKYRQERILEKRAKILEEVSEGR